MSLLRARHVEDDDGPGHAIIRMTVLDGLRAAVPA
jgi:hypothetical protein